MDLNFAQAYDHCALQNGLRQYQNIYLYTLYVLYRYHELSHYLNGMSKNNYMFE